MNKNFILNITDFSLIAIVILLGLIAIIFSGEYPFFSIFSTKNFGNAVPTNEMVDIRIGQLKDHTGTNNITQNVSKEKTGGQIHNFFPKMLAAVFPVKCDIIFTYSPEVQSVSLGSTITYHINVKNIGELTCQNVSFSLYYGDNARFQSSIPQPSSSDYYWFIGNLNSKEEYSVAVVMKHTDTGTFDSIKNEGCATANNGADACVENTVSVSAGLATIPPPPQPQSPTDNPVLPTSLVLDISRKFSVPENKEFGTWIWESPIQMNASSVTKLLRSASEGGMNAVYITIDDYLDIAKLPEGYSKDQLKKSYLESLSLVVTEANALGIEVDVEGGAKDWAIKTNRWKGYALIDFVKEYNRQYPNAKVRNFQYDVEPYLLSSYEKNKASVLKSFIEFIDESTTKMQGVDAGFTVVIPHFYDSGQKWTPAITYNGTTKYAYSHLLSILERKPGSTIIIMSYRNFFYGNNGTEQISEVEIKEASNGGFKTRVVVAQETGNVLPDYVTFYGHSRTQLFENLETIYNDFSSYSSFYGTAVHYIDSFLVLK